MADFPKHTGKSPPLHSSHPLDASTVEQHTENSGTASAPQSNVRMSTKGKSRAVDLVENEESVDVLDLARGTRGSSPPCADSHGGDGSAGQLGQHSNITSTTTESRSHSQAHNVHEDSVEPHCTTAPFSTPNGNTTPPNELALHHTASDRAHDEGSNRSIAAIPLQSSATIQSRFTDFDPHTSSGLTCLSFSKSTSRPRPLLPHRNSAPHVQTVGNGRSGNSQASTSRHVDAEHHWLSEDEGRAQPFMTGRRRTLTRKRSDAENRHSAASTQDSTSDSPKPPFHHRRPSAKPLQNSSTRASSEPLSATVPLATLLTTLVARLTCPACNHLLRDPTTLACGHTSCIACTLPRPLQIRRSSADIRLEGGLSSESQFARNPATPMARSTSGGLFSSIINLGAPLISPPPGTTSSYSSTISRSDPRTVGRPKLTCPHPNCTRKGRAGTHATPKTDYVLQKILSLLRREVSNVDRFTPIDEDADFDMDSVGEREAPDESSVFSGSSGSGGQETENHESKRDHRVRREWSTSKRARRTSLFDTTTSELNVIDLDLSGISDSFVSELQSELECQVCVQLFYDPITSPCGHTFCQKCLARALDHSDKCPLCRTDFPSFTYFQTQPVNSTTAAVILAGWPTYASDRKLALELEEKSSTLDTAIFICTLAWPSLPTYIHIFEPRYRLMIRRVMDGDRQFGMVLPSRDGGAHEFGTMLHVRSCNMIEDGRSVVETIGTYRFRLLEKGTLDGYTVGRIERVDDVSPEQEEALERNALARNPPVLPSSPSAPDLSTSMPSTGGQQIELSTTELMEVCLEFVTTLRSGSAPWVLQRLNNTIGPMPTDPAEFSFWMAEVMPVDDHVKAALLQITSARERLRLVVFWIEQFRSSWWFSRGCHIM